MGTFHLDSHNVYRAAPLEEFEWLTHGFGTRHSAGFAAEARLATLHQIHSDTVIEAAGRAGCLGSGDALLENTPGVLIGVKTADCVPVLLADPQHRVVAAVHAGWRGTASHIAQKTLAAMEEKFSTQPGDVIAAIGPSIGKCCYEVGPEVAAHLADFDPALAALSGPVHLDLAAINRRQLASLGVRQIYSADLCTKCRPEFHSYRRDKERAGRMISAIGVIH